MGNKIGANLHPINEIEILLGIKEVVHRMTSYSKTIVAPICGADSKNISNASYGVTCIECLKICKTKLEKELEGNPISPSYNQELEWVIHHLKKVHE